MIFTQGDWNRFRNDVVGTRQELPAPAYKTGNLPLQIDDSSHIIDFLMCQARQVVDSALTDLHKFMQSSGASTRDPDVENYWNHFEASFGDLSNNGRARSKWFLHLRNGLKSDVDACLREWNGLMGSGVQDYREKVGIAYASWRAIKPRILEGRESDSANMVRKILAEDSPVVLDLANWELLKASWAFKHHHKRRFMWQVAGRQLQAIKALASRVEETLLSIDRVPVPVVSNMYAALKPDNTYVKRLMAMGEDEHVNYDTVPEVTGLPSPVWGAGQ